MDWTAVIALIMQIVTAILNKKKAADFKSQLTAASQKIEVPDGGDKGEASRQLLEKVYEDTPRGQIFQRATLRFFIHEVPAAANKSKPGLTPAQITEGKKLASLVE